MSELVGRWEMMRYVERKKKNPLNPPSKKGDLKRVFAELIVFPDVLKLAQEFFLTRDVITKSEFKKISKQMQRKSFTVAKVSDKVVLDAINDKLTDALESGTTVQDFVDDIDKVFDTIGLTPLNPDHLRTVFLTNTLTGYGEGRKQVIDSLDDDEFPFRQVVTVGDDRVRDPHEEIDGYTAKKDDSVWTWLITPFSWRCRCGIWPVHKSEGLTASGYVPDVRGKKGFEFL